MLATLRKSSPRIVVQDAWQVSRHVGRGMFTALAELGIARATPPKSQADAVARQSLAAKAMTVAADLITVVEGEMPRSPCLLVANHVCDLDPIVLLAQTPALLVVRRQVGEQLVLGSVARALEVVFVEEDHFSRINALRRVDEALRAGVSVLNFPEGTPSPTAMPQRFARGTFGIAQRLNIPVVPIAITFACRVVVKPRCVSASARRCSPSVMMTPRYWRRVRVAPSLACSSVSTALLTAPAS